MKLTILTISNKTYILTNVKKAITKIDNSILVIFKDNTRKVFDLCEIVEVSND